MATFKNHLFKQAPNGKLYTSKTECGRGAFTQNGAPNVMLKSNAFKMIYENGGECCAVCVARAKQQGRL